MKNVNRIKLAIAAAAIVASVPAVATRSADALPAKAQAGKAPTSGNGLSGNGQASGHQNGKGKGHEHGKGKGHIKYDSPG